MENIVVAICVLFVAGVHGECDTQGSGMCFASYGQATQGLGQSVIAFDSQTLDLICNGLPGVEGCVGDKLDGCSNDLTGLQLVGTLKGLNSLCEPDNKQKYLDSKDCASDTEATQGVEGCVGTIDERVANAQNAKDACKVMNGGFKCSYDVMERACGKDAADVQLEVLTSLSEALLKPINCDIDLDSSGAASVSFSVGLLVILAVIARLL